MHAHAAAAAGSTATTPPHLNEPRALALTDARWRAERPTKLTRGPPRSLPTLPGASADSWYPRTPYCGADAAGCTELPIACKPVGLSQPGLHSLQASGAIRSPVRSNTAAGTRPACLHIADLMLACMHPALAQTHAMRASILAMRVPVPGGPPPTPRPRHPWKVMWIRQGPNTEAMS